MQPPFHLAIGVHDLSIAREFYGGLLGCVEGRSADAWVDFNFHGHQLVVHVDPNTTPQRMNSGRMTNAVDSKAVPIPHFGVVLEMDAWQALAETLTTAGVEFVIEPYTRFEGEPGEQATMFLLDPSGNAIEFKAFRDIEGQLFAK